MCSCNEKDNKGSAVMPESIITWGLASVPLQLSSPLQLCFLSRVRQEEKALLAATSKGVWPALFFKVKFRLGPQLMRKISKELDMSEFASLWPEQQGFHLLKLEW